MGFFGRRQEKGISEYELNHKHIESHLHSVFPNTSIGRRKRAALDTAMEQALDTESASSRYGVVTGEEFEGILTSLKEGRIISDNEVKKLYVAAENALKD